MNNTMIALPILSVDFTNWKGDRRRRRLIPVELWFGSTNWHPKPQYLMKCMDADDNNAVKDFPLALFHMDTTRLETV